MIRTLLPLLALAGCAPTVAADVPPADAGAAAPMEGACKIQELSDLVGKKASAALTADALRRSGAKSSRIIGPDTMVTMDYRADRLNIHTDAAGTVTDFRCG